MLPPINRTPLFLEQHRRAIVEDMEIGLNEIDDFIAVRVCYIHVDHVPSPVKSPIEHIGPRRKFVNVHGDVLFFPVQGFTDAVPGDDPTDLVQICN